MPIIFDVNNPFLPGRKEDIVGPDKSGPWSICPENAERALEASRNVWDHQYHRVYKHEGVFKIGSPLHGEAFIGTKYEAIPFKVSFDFDSTLSTKKIQLLLSVMNRTATEVFIITSRNETDHITPNSDVIAVAKAFGIPNSNIYCTNGMPKSRVLERLKIDIHFDDMPDEIAMINAECTHTLGCLVSRNIWGDLKYLETSMDVTPTIQTELEEFE